MLHKIYLKSIDSTQLYLKRLLKQSPNEYFVYTTNQTQGIGSKNNKWIGVKGNLFFSFCILKNNLPNDLRLESCSIYFSYLLKDILKMHGSMVFIKWPNDQLCKHNQYNWYNSLYQILYHKLCCKYFPDCSCER